MSVIRCRIYQNVDAFVRAIPDHFIRITGKRKYTPLNRIVSTRKDIYNRIRERHHYLMVHSHNFNRSGRVTKITHLNEAERKKCTFLNQNLLNPENVYKMSLRKFFPLYQSLHHQTAYITGRYTGKVSSRESRGTSFKRILFKLLRLITLFKDNNITYKLYSSQKGLLTDFYLTKYLVRVLHDFLKLGLKKYVQFSTGFFFKKCTKFSRILQRSHKSLALLP